MPVTVPEPLPASETDRVCVTSANVAVTAWSALIVTVHEPVPLHPAPDQPAKLEPDAADAVSVTDAPSPKLREHVLGQERPPPATTPLPVPVRDTAKVWVTGGGGGGALAVNVAVTERLALIVTVHEPVPLQPPPDQPAKLDPDAAFAVSVAFEPLLYECVHVPGHEIPEPVTLPEPLPARFTVRRCVA